jgi:hypothetical protein
MEQNNDVQYNGHWGSFIRGALMGIGLGLILAVFSIKEAYTRIHARISNLKKPARKYEDNQKPAL